MYGKQRKGGSTVTIAVVLVLCLGAYHLVHLVGVFIHNQEAAFVACLSDFVHHLLVSVVLYRLSLQCHQPVHVL